MIPNKNSIFKQKCRILKNKLSRKYTIKKAHITLLHFDENTNLIICKIKYECNTLYYQRLGD